VHYLHIISNGHSYCNLALMLFLLRLLKLTYLWPFKGDDASPQSDV
jgi:hypothetical protein